MKHRTALVTAGAIAAVVFAGAIAVGANLGILTVADSKPVGKLTAATVAQPSAPQATPKYATKKAVAAQDSQKYIIRTAGAVKVTFSKTGVRLVDVSAKRHWKWALSQTGDKKLTVTFKHGSDTYTFLASVGRHGKITARVDHPITKVTPAASSGGGGSTTWVASPAASPATAPAHVAGGEPSDSDEGGDADD